MQRRNFIKTVSTGIVGLALPSIAMARTANKAKPEEMPAQTTTEIPKQAGTWKTIEIKTQVDVTIDSATRIWLPTPLAQTSYQELISSEWNGNFLKAGIAKDKKYSSQIFYANWEKAEKAELTVTYLVRVRNRAHAEPSGDEMINLYLQPTTHLPLDGIVKETAQKIIKSEKNPDKKARMIYDWIVENTARDSKIRGCGLGDVKTLLMSGNFTGKCADLSSLYVALCRASGIPAREVFGLRVLASNISKSIGKTGDVTKGQHCRAEYYSKSKGWVPVDPADIRKIILEENLDLHNTHVKNVREKFFGFWEMNWVAYNSARDFALPPSYAEEINYLMYPRLASEKTKNDGMDPDEFKYTITAKEIGQPV
jgi:transglutaminase-like putative cysteine protease